MINKRISELNPAAPLQDGDLLAVVQDTGSENETRRTTVGALRSGMGGAQTVITSVDGSIIVNKQGNTVDLSRDFYVLSGAISDYVNSRGNGYYRIATFTSSNSGSNAKFGLLFDFYIVDSPQQQTVNGSCIIDLYGSTCNFLYSMYRSKSRVSNNTTPVFNPAESLFLVSKGTDEFELWLQIKFNPTNFVYGIKRYNYLKNFILEDRDTGYKVTDINSISGTKIYGEIENIICDNSRVLVINDGNASQYFTHAYGDNQYDVYMNIPEEYSTFVIETTATYRIVKIQPQGGINFDDYKKIMIIGNVVLWQGESYNTSSPNYGNYRISQYWYSHRHSSNNEVREAFAEFILKNKVWYSVFY